MRYKILFALLSCCTISSINAQEDSLKQLKYKRIAFHTLTGATYVGSFAILNNAWYKQYDRSAFHWFNDLGEWEQVDKFGHAQSAYFISSNLLFPIYKELGYTNKQSVLLASGVAWVYQGTIELLDGYSKEWGASISDIGANTIGISLFASQQLLWNEQRILFKYSTSVTNYGVSDPIILNRVSNLYGSSLAEKLFKDYNGTTFWLSWNLNRFLPENNSFPKWLCISTGYGAQGMLGGFDNTWKKDGVQYSYLDFPRYRQYYLSLDVDFTKIPIKGKVWKFVSPILNIFKLPAPTLEFNKFGTKAHLIYF